MVLLLAGRRIVPLSEAWTAFKTGTLWAKYRRDNPLESARLDAYMAVGGPYPVTSTATGTGLARLGALIRGDLNG